MLLDKVRIIPKQFNTFKRDFSFFYIKKTLDILEKKLKIAVVEKIIDDFRQLTSRNNFFTFIYFSLNDFEEL